MLGMLGMYHEVQEEEEKVEAEKFNHLQANDISRMPPPYPRSPGPARQLHTGHPRPSERVSKHTPVKSPQRADEGSR